MTKKDFFQGKLYEVKVHNYGRFPHFSINSMNGGLQESPYDPAIEESLNAANSPNEIDRVIYQNFNGKKGLKFL